jgi:hypothetical protein
MRPCVGQLYARSKFSEDCQGCARRSPNNERSIAEFCENGFQAVRYEATQKLDDREFSRSTRITYWASCGRWLDAYVKNPPPMRAAH